MFDFLKKKKPEPEKPYLFTMPVILEPYNSQVLDKGAQVLKVDGAGNAWASGAPAGKIRAYSWEYIKYFGAVKDLKRTKYNEFNADVYGEADKTLIISENEESPHLYECDITKAIPRILPNVKYICSLDDKGTYIEVYVGGVKAGTCRDKHNRLENIRKFLSYGWQTTAILKLKPENCRVFVSIEKNVI